MPNPDKNCKGYVLFKLGVLVPERFVNIPRVSDLSQWFVETDFRSAQAIAMIQGLKSDTQSKPNHTVSHMLYIEKSNLLSQRSDIDQIVTTITLSDLLTEFLNEGGTCYPIMLKLLAH